MACKDNRDERSDSDSGWDPSQSIECLPSQHIHASPAGKRRLKRPAVVINEEQASDDTDDDDLEILLVIQPPTPKRPKSPQTRKRTHEQEQEQEQQQNVEMGLRVVANLPLTSVKQEARTCTRSSLNYNPNDPSCSSRRVSCSPEVSSNESLNSIPSDSFSKTPPTNTNMNIHSSIDCMDATTTAIPTTISASASASAAMIKPTYTYRTSAYVQNLAEICQTILSDRRWRVNHNRNMNINDGRSHSRHRLLAWERGDDLSAVYALSRLYQKNNTIPTTTASATPHNHEQNQTQKQRSSKCLLCRTMTVPTEEESPSKARPKNSTVHDTKEIHNHTEEAYSSSSPSNHAKNAATSVASVAAKETKNRIESEQDTMMPPSLSYPDEERALHLYCRIYYRKGPWFRLDDLYSRYYAPNDESDNAQKQNETHNRNENNLRQEEEETTDGATDQSNVRIILEHESNSKKKKLSFFQPKQSSGCKDNAKTVDHHACQNTTSHREATTGAHISCIIDQGTIDEKLQGLKLLHQDMMRLYSMGLVRSFTSESECGKTAGAVSDEGSGVVLTVEERRSVLTRLGGSSSTGGKKPQDKGGRSSYTSASHNNGKTSSSSSRENQVWKQMCRQQSISGKLRKSCTRKKQ